LNEALSFRPWHIDALDGTDHVVAVADRLGIYANVLRQNIRESNQLGDMVTNDIFIEISRAIDKRLWLLEAHLQTFITATQSRLML
jgi:starvation-inducible DNA-binding protein